MNDHLELITSLEQPKYDRLDTTLDALTLGTSRENLYSYKQTI